MAGEYLTGSSEFRSVLDQLDGVAIWTSSEPRKFDWMSSGFEDIWGVPAADVEDDIGVLMDGIHPEDRERIRSIMRLPKSEVADQFFEHRVVRPDGSVRWVQVEIIPILEDGDISKVVGVTTDITTQRQRELEIDALNRIIRHDIRNDMSIILGWAELLEEHVDGAGREKLQKIIASGKDIVELTEVAREYAKAVTEHGEIELEPIALHTALQEEIEKRRAFFPEAEFVVSGEIPRVEVMANEMLGSVFRNILNNAVQHNDTADPRVGIGVKTDDEIVSIEIADNGPGIPDAQKRAIFQQGSKGLESSGSGIGVHLVNKLVSRYGGEIRIEDNTPRGSVFTVELPRADT